MEQCSYEQREVELYLLLLQCQIPLERMRMELAEWSICFKKDRISELSYSFLTKKAESGMVMSESGEPGTLSHLPVLGDADDTFFA
jgi:hypothetical protein